jgi:hypothetical protein
MASFHAEYPAAQRLDLVEDLFGHRVADPYRWLEDADSPQTSEWLAAEESLWEYYRAGLPERETFASRVRELLLVRVGGAARLARDDAVLHAAGPGPGARGPLRYKW